jgi:NifU-like protein involved in Fe-S cluster formation
MPPRRVSSLIDDPLHAGPLDGASVVGQAEHGGLVTIGLWLDAEDRVVRARFRATSCPALVAYAEAACALAEADGADRALDAARIRACVSGVHPVHHDRADAVALAFTRALPRRHSHATAQDRP